jgi:hypothetical protein
MSRVDAIRAPPAAGPDAAGGPGSNARETAGGKGPEEPPLAAGAGERRAPRPGPGARFTYTKRRAGTRVIR